MADNICHIFYSVNFINSSSVIIGILSSFAFLFFDDEEFTSLFMR